MKEYVLNIEELEKRKQKSLIYSNDNFDWNKNSIALLSIIDQVKFQNKTKESFDILLSRIKTICFDLSKQHDQAKCRIDPPECKM